MVIPCYFPVVTGENMHIHLRNSYLHVIVYSESVGIQPTQPRSSANRQLFGGWPLYPKNGLKIDKYLSAGETKSTRFAYDCTIRERYMAYYYVRVEHTLHSWVCPRSQKCLQSLLVKWE